MIGEHKAALLLIGHGSGEIASAHRTTRRLANALRRTGRFSEVRDCFLKELPAPSLDLVASPLVYVVPNFAGEGYFSRKLIPEQLGLTGRVTKIGGRKIIYCDPVGSHPAIADLVLDHGLDLCELNLLRPEQTALLMIRHGSPRTGEMDPMSRDIADSIRKAGRFAEIVTVFLEQEPFVADWPSLIDSQTVIATPMLVGDGYHASLQIPSLFNLTRPDGGPVSVAGRTVWLTPSLWHNPGMVDIALDLVASADREAERLDRQRAFG